MRRPQLRLRLLARIRLHRDSGINPRTLEFGIYHSLVSRPYVRDERLPIHRSIFGRATLGGIGGHHLLGDAVPIGRSRPLEELLRAALDAVQLTLRKHQVDVHVALAVGGVGVVHRQRVRMLYADDAISHPARETDLVFSLG